MCNIGKDSRESPTPRPALWPLTFVAVTLIIVAIGAVRAADVAGVRIDHSVRVGGIDLVLNGAGLRSSFMTSIYVIGLYLPEPRTSADAAISVAGPKRIALTLMRDVSAQSLVDALYEGVRDNTSEAEFAHLKNATDALAAIMLPLQVAKKGDVVAIDYVPNSGAQVVVNGRSIGQAIPGKDLYRALIKIWLGDAPVDTKLKRALLLGSPPKGVL
jgi:Chalcone isomerase-like